MVRSTSRRKARRRCWTGWRRTCAVARAWHGSSSSRASGWRRPVSLMGFPGVRTCSPLLARGRRKRSTARYATWRTNENVVSSACEIMSLELPCCGAWHGRRRSHRRDERQVPHGPSSPENQTEVAAVGVFRRAADDDWVMPAGRTEIATDAEVVAEGRTFPHVEGAHGLCRAAARIPHPAGAERPQGACSRAGARSCGRGAGDCPPRRRGPPDLDEKGSGPGLIQGFRLFGALFILRAPVLFQAVLRFPRRLCVV